MSKLEDSVNEILGLDSKKIEPEKFEVPVPRDTGKSVTVEKYLDKDSDYSRENYYNLIEKGQEAIQGILDIAKEGQHPRAYEVVGQLIGQVGDTVDKLQDLQKKLKDLKDLPGRTSATIKNALFVGSTAELQKMLNKNRENETAKSKTKEPKKD